MLYRMLVFILKVYPSKISITNFVAVALRNLENYGLKIFPNEKILNRKNTVYAEKQIRARTELVHNFRPKKILKYLIRSYLRRTDPVQVREC
jgi:hypothetical protein